MLRMTKWDKVFSVPNSGFILQDFVDGRLNIEEVQQQFRNVYPEASAEVRRVIRMRGAKESRRLARKALRRRGLLWE